jgi:hypothetical protein
MNQITGGSRAWYDEKAATGSLPANAQYALGVAELHDDE